MHFGRDGPAAVETVGSNFGLVADHSIARIHNRPVGVMLYAV